MRSPALLWYKYVENLSWKGNCLSSSGEMRRWRRAHQSLAIADEGAGAFNVDIALTSEQSRRYRIAGTGACDLQSVGLSECNRKRSETGQVLVFQWVVSLQSGREREAVDIIVGTGW